MGETLSLPGIEEKIMIIIVNDSNSSRVSSDQAIDNCDMCQTLHLKSGDEQLGCRKL